MHCCRRCRVAWQPYAWGSVEIIGLLGASAVAWILFVLRLLTAAEPFVPLAVMFNPVVAAGTASNFFVMGTLVALSIYVPIYFEAVVGLSASQSGLALIALMGGTVTGAQIAGRIMVWTPHYKRGPLVGLVVSTGAVTALATMATSLPFVALEVLLALTGAGLGTAFPVATVAVQNAVEPHQLGTTTATFNFFRSLGSAILVAASGDLSRRPRPRWQADRLAGGLGGGRGGERHRSRAGVQLRLRGGGGDAGDRLPVLRCDEGVAAAGALGGGVSGQRRDAVTTIE